MFLFLKDAGLRAESAAWAKSLGLRSRKWKTVSCLRYRQSDISSPKKNNRMIKPLTTRHGGNSIHISKPGNDADDQRNRRSQEYRQPAKGCNGRPSPRMQQGQQHNRRRRDQRQIQANPSGVQPVGNSLTFVVVWFEHLWGFQFDFNRLTGGFHRRQIELDLDRDRLANQFLGHSP